jgi:hypothetical protein
MGRCAEPSAALIQTRVSERSSSREVVETV